MIYTGNGHNKIYEQVLKELNQSFACAIMIDRAREKLGKKGLYDQIEVEHRKGMLPLHEARKCLVWVAGPPFPITIYNVIKNDVVVDDLLLHLPPNQVFAPQYRLTQGWIGLYCNNQGGQWPTFSEVLWCRGILDLVHNNTSWYKGLPANLRVIRF